MAAPVDDDVSLGEIGRRLDAVATELRSLRSELVRRDVWEAERRADGLEVAALKARLDTHDGSRRQASLALFIAALGFVSAILLRLV